MPIHKSAQLVETNMRKVFETILIEMTESGTNLPPQTLKKEQKDEEEASK